jgi:hypothetical protein
MKHNKATFGIYRSKEEINAAVSLLSSSGFGEARASVLFPDHAGAQDFPQVQRSEIAKFARIGAMLGAGLFLTFMVLALSGVIPFARMSAVPAEGRLFAVIASVFVGGIIGAACGTLVGIGTPDRAGNRYGQYVHAGGILLSVHTDTHDDQKKVEAILDKSGAQDITSVDESQAWKDVINEKNHLERDTLSRLAERFTGQSSLRTLSASPSIERSIEQSVKQQEAHI